MKQGNLFFDNNFFLGPVDYNFVFGGLVSSFWTTPDVFWGSLLALHSGATPSELRDSCFPGLLTTAAPCIVEDGHLGFLLFPF